MSITRTWGPVALGIGVGAALAAVRSAREAAALRTFDGAVVVITGGSRGLGLALARRLVALGARVAICGRDEATLERARADLAARGGDVIALPADVSDDVEAARFVDHVDARWGRIDVLVTCAATIQVGPIETMSVRDVHTAMESIFWTAVHPTLAVLPIMRAQGGGRIAHVTSIGGKVAVPHLLPYSAAKFAEVGFSEGLRAEVARHGIGVTTIVPGLMRTGAHVHATFKGHEAHEYAWFGASATTPLVSIDADRAAAEIALAIARGEDEVVLGGLAKVAERAHALAPSLTSRLASLADRLLPRATGASAAEPAREGIEIERREHERPSVRAIARRHADAERLHQL